MAGTANDHLEQFLQNIQQFVTGHKRIHQASGVNYDQEALVKEIVDADAGTVAAPPASVAA